MLQPEDTNKSKIFVETIALYLVSRALGNYWDRAAVSENKL